MAGRGLAITSFPLRPSRLGGLSSFHTKASRLHASQARTVPLTQVTGRNEGELTLDAPFIARGGTAVRNRGPTGTGPCISLINQSGRTVFAVHVFPDGTADEDSDGTAPKG